MIQVLSLGVLVLGACANDKPASDASSASAETTTTSARALDSVRAPDSRPTSSSPNGGGWTDKNLSASSNGNSGSTTTSSPGNGGNAAGASQQPALTAPPPPNAAQNQNGGATLTPMDQGNDTTDLKITQQIRKAVVGDSSLSFTAKNVKIITQNGKVALRGQVNSDEEKRSIEATAVKVVGNANVDDQLVVKK